MQKLYILNFLRPKTVKSISLILLLFSVIMSSDIMAQLAPRCSQFMMNEFLINPATAGLEGYTVLSVTGRKEWLGFSSGTPTPETYSFGLHGRLLKGEARRSFKANRNKYAKLRKSNVGLGLSFMADYNGALQHHVINLVYAYHIKMNKSTLSMGLNGSFHQMGIREKYLSFEDNNDVMMGMANGRSYTPDAGAGINLSSNHYSLGISLAQLFESPMIFGNSEVELQYTSLRYGRFYYLKGSYRNAFQSHSSWEYAPALLVKSSDPFQSPINYQADILLNMIYNNSYWFGVGYRTSKDYIALAGFQYNTFYFTYSFDYGPNEITHSSYGSHEISITLKLGNPLRELKCRADN